MTAPTSLHDLPAAERDLLDRIAGLAEVFAAEAGGFDERAEIAVGNLAALHEAGLDAAVLPAHLGGTGLSYQAFGEAVRILAAADPSTATIFTMHS